MKQAISMVLFFISALIYFPGIAQDLYKAPEVNIDFYSSAPVEDIHAVSKEGISVLNINTGELSFQVKIRSFQFRKAKMQEHFNENYMESHKYPVASFKGKIKEQLDLSSDGEKKVTIVGVLDVHGRKKNREISALIRKQNDQISLNSEFNVACKDHDIEIPKLLWKNIAEVVLVKVNTNYSKI